MYMLRDHAQKKTNIIVVNTHVEDTDKHIRTDRNHGKKRPPSIQLSLYGVLCATESLKLA
jgi:hypothetical protein